MVARPPDVANGGFGHGAQARRHDAQELVEIERAGEEGAELDELGAQALLELLGPSGVPPGSR